MRPLNSFTPPHYQELRKAIVSLLPSRLAQWAYACHINFRQWRKCRWIRARRRNVFYIVFNPQQRHAGLADQLKAIVGCYYIAKENGYDFKIIHPTPFILENFLTPNEVDWLAKPDDIDYSLSDTRFYNYLHLNWGKDVPRLAPRKQYLCYVHTGHDIITEHFKLPVALWAECYHKLFKPNHPLQQLINDTKLLPRQYVAVHLRFVNALENFEEGYDNSLSPQRQQELMERCRAGIMKVVSMQPQGCKVVCFSDSKRFLDTLDPMPVHVLDSKHVGHTGQTGDEATVYKTFLDFYIISQSHCLYKIVAPEMYSGSVFPVFAAKLGGVPVKMLNV